MSILKKLQGVVRRALGCVSPSELHMVAYDDISDMEQLQAKAIEYLRQLNQNQLHLDITAPTDPCETCLRWPECNGVDANTCPLCRWEENKLKYVPAGMALTALDLEAVLKNKKRRY